MRKEVNVRDKGRGEEETHMIENPSRGWIERGMNEFRKLER